MSSEPLSLSIENKILQPVKSCNFAAKPLLFAVCIIFGLGGLSLISLGSLYFVANQSGWQIGLISQIGNPSALIMVVVGSVSAIAALILGLRNDHRVDEPSSDGQNHHVPEVQKEVLLYMSISGNPAHLGHMAALGTAIKELEKRKETISKALVSLSSQAYLEEKQRATIDKVCYTYAERIRMLQHVILEAKTQNMFGTVDVEFWDDQEEGYSDHPISYDKLTKSNPLKKVILITGTDLCRSMANWCLENIAHAVVVSRGQGDKDTRIERGSRGEILKFTHIRTNKAFVCALETADKSRYLLANAFPAYEHYSSTAIRTGKIQVAYV